MSRLKRIIDEAVIKAKLLEAEDEAPEEEMDMDMEDPGAGEDPVEGAEEANDEAGMDEEPTEEEDPEAGMEDDVADANAMADEPTDENFDDLDKAIEGMVGITDIQHTTSSTILDFEDGGQIMYVQPMVSIQSSTLMNIIALVIEDVKNTYSNQIDEITGRPLSTTKYWNSIEALISTMVRSQLTKSDNIDGLIDEIKQIFKVLEVK